MASNEKLANNGIVNPNGITWLGAGAFYLAFVPVTSWVTGENGIVQKLVETVIGLIPGGSGVAKDKVIPALSAAYIFTAFGWTGAMSVAAQAMSRKDGLDNNQPRSHQGSIVGLPLRMRAAHLNLMENFPGFALAAALAYSTAPANQRLINLLGYHFLMKTFVFIPCYLADVAPLRSFAHLTATASVINVAWRVATGNH